MSVVLLILKIIGIILLAILGLLILAVLLVLFVPVRYLLKVDKAEGDDISAEIKLSWLLHLLRINVKYYNELTYYAKLLFFTVVKSDNLITEKEKLKAAKKEERKKRREEKKKLKTQDKEESENSVENTVTDISDKDTGLIEESSVELKYDVKNDSTEISETIDKKKDDTSTDVPEKKTLIDRIIFVIDKLLFVINKFIDLIFNINDKFFDVINKIDEIWDELDFYIDAVNDERNRAAVSVCYDRIKELLHSIRPRKVKGYIHAGFDDPYTNGKMMSIYGILLPIIHDKIQLVPEYDKEVLDGYLIVKGRITVFIALKLVYVYYFNKDVKRLKKMFKSHKESR